MENPKNENYSIIFRAWRINPKTNEKEWAKDFGKKAWPIKIDCIKKNRS